MNDLELERVLRRLPEEMAVELEGWEFGTELRARVQQRIALETTGVGGGTGADWVGVMTPEGIHSPVGSHGKTAKGSVWTRWRPWLGALAAAAAVAGFALIRGGLPLGLEFLDGPGVAAPAKPQAARSAAPTAPVVPAAPAAPAPAAAAKAADRPQAADAAAAAEVASIAAAGGAGGSQILSETFTPLPAEPVMKAAGVLPEAMAPPSGASRQGAEVESASPSAGPPAEGMTAAAAADTESTALSASASVESGAAPGPSLTAPAPPPLPAPSRPGESARGPADGRDTAAAWQGALSNQLRITVQPPPGTGGQLRYRGIGPVRVDFWAQNVSLFPMGGPFAVTASVQRVDGEPVLGSPGVTVAPVGGMHDPLLAGAIQTWQVTWDRRLPGNVPALPGEYRVELRIANGFSQQVQAAVIRLEP